MMSKIKTDYTEVFLVVISIVLTAAFLRFGAIQYVEFKGDEARAAFLAIDLVDKGVFPLVGEMSSIGAHNPPIFVYLLSAPFLFSKSPVVASGYIVILNILAIWLCFLFCREFFNTRVAVLAAALFSVNPWVIFYSRKIWAQDALPLFVMSLFYFLFKVAVKKENRLVYIVMLFVATGTLTQLHFSSAPVTFLAMHYL